MCIILSITYHHLTQLSWESVYRDSFMEKLDLEGVYCGPGKAVSDATPVVHVEPFSYSVTKIVTSFSEYLKNQCSGLPCRKLHSELSQLHNVVEIVNMEGSSFSLI